MVVTADDNIRPVLNQPICGALVNAAIVSGMDPRLRVGCAGRQTTQPDADVRMEQTKQPDAQRALQNRSADGEGQTRVELVSVRQVNALAVQSQIGWTRQELQTDFVTQVASEPDVVVTGEDRDGNPTLNESVEFEDDTGAARRDRRAILEPEIEQIAYDVE